MIWFLYLTLKIGAMLAGTFALLLAFVWIWRRHKRELAVPVVLLAFIGVPVYGHHVNEHHANEEAPAPNPACPDHKPPFWIPVPNPTGVGPAFIPLPTTWPWKWL